MADANFSTSEVSGLVKTTYNLFAANALRPNLQFVDVAKVDPSNLAMPGSVHTFTFYPEMAAATTALNEVTDPDVVNVTPTTKTVTLLEYGNAARSTRKFRGTAYVPAPDRDIAELIGYNAGLTQDTLARNAIVAGSNVTYAGNATARNTIDESDTLTGAKVRYITAKLRGASARGWGDMGVPGDAYAGFIHPDVSVDLRAETGAAGWAEPANNSDADRRWRGIIGKFEGVGFIETPRAPIVEDASDGSSATGPVDVYQSIFCGAECIAYSFGADNSKMPEFVIGPVVDRLRRHHTFGWWWLGGFAVYREEALWRVESASSIGDNS